MSRSPTIGELLGFGQRQLCDSASPRLDAELLLSHVLEIDRTGVYRERDARVDADRRASYERLLAVRASGKPMAQIFERAEFWSLSLFVNEHVLIPRPETELLVELALSEIPPDRDCLIADLGTGSGAVAAAIATERPNARIIATDASSEALAVAARNIDALGLSNVRLVKADWYLGLGDLSFDLVLSNPPYVRETDEALLGGAISHEPVTALAAGADGLEAMRRIVAGAHARLRPRGGLLVEHGFDQGRAVRALMVECGLPTPATHRDLAGNERVSWARRG